MGPTFVTSAYQHPQRPKGMDKLVHIDGAVLGRFLHPVPDAPRRLAMLVGGGQVLARLAPPRSWLPTLKPGASKLTVPSLDECDRWLLQGLSPRPSFGGFGLSCWGLVVEWLQVH